MIDNSYAEHLVKRNAPSWWIFAKAGMILLCIASLLLMVRMPFGIIFPVAAAVGTWFVFQNGDVEYEYLYIDRQLTVDKIAGRARRKRVAEYDMADVEAVAPADSGRIKDLEHKVQKTLDFSSGAAGARTYGMIYSKSGSCIKIIIEPDEKMLKLMKQSLPRIFSEY